MANETLDRMTRSAINRTLQVGRCWRAPRHRSALGHIARMTRCPHCHRIATPLRIMRVTARRPYICPHCQQPSQLVRHWSGLRGGLGGGLTAVAFILLIRWLGLLVAAALFIPVAFTIITTVFWLLGRLSSLNESPTRHVA